MREKGLKVACWILLNIVLLTTTACAGFPTASIKLKVVDDRGLPLSGAKAVVTFEGAEMFTGKVRNKTFSGLTDENGIFTTSFSTNTYVSFGVEMEGWYKSHGVYRFTEQKLGKWQPWNPEIKVVMRKIEKPVPMYVTDLRDKHPGVIIPVNDKNVGFDLMEVDWVAPYGKGKYADFLFRVHSNYKNKDDFDATLTITFPGEYDGSQFIKDDRKNGSIFTLPRYAPEDGYQKQIIRNISSHGPGAPKKDSRDDNNYIFRVRSEKKDGVLWRAIYGKIEGDIEFYPNKQGALLLFKYFLNPDYTRNLEYGGRNLFQ